MVVEEPASGDSDEVASVTNSVGDSSAADGGIRLIS